MYKDYAKPFLGLDRFGLIRWRGLATVRGILATSIKLQCVLSVRFCFSLTSLISPIPKDSKVLGRMRVKS